MEKQTYDGVAGKVSGMQGNKTLEGEELEELKERVNIFPELTYDANGYKTTLKGIEEIDGQKAYKIVIESPAGKKSTEYYAMETSLKIRSVTSEGEAVDISDYKEIDGILFPHIYSMTLPGAPMKMEMKVEKIEVNGAIDESIFK